MIRVLTILIVLMIGAGVLLALARRRGRAGRCPECGHSLPNIASPRCPACGESI